MFAIRFGKHTVDVLSMIDWGRQKCLSYALNAEFMIKLVVSLLKLTFNKKCITASM